jgi:predicted CoA-binding protein
MTDDPSDQSIIEALRGTRTIAVVGASDKPQRASHAVMAYLQERGYRCIPVNPRLAGGHMRGETVYPDLAAIPIPVDMVDVFRVPAEVGPIADAAIAIGARVLWMQLGVINEAAAARARRAGLVVIMDRCPVIEWRRLGARIEA